MSNDPIKDVLNRIPYGFYSITSRAGDEVNIMVATWLMQSSFEPRLLTLALQKTSHTHSLVEQGRVFAVNIFNVDDQEAIKNFTKGREKDPDKVKNASYKPGPETGCPILDSAAAYLECRVQQIIDVGGDHDLVVGEIVGAGERKPGEAEDCLTLLDIGWSYAG